MKKLVSLLLVFVMVMSIFAVVPVGAIETEIATTGGLALDQLKAKFPQDAYWNHKTTSGHTWYGTATHGGSCNNPDGYTWTPCTYSNHNSGGVGIYDCNSYGGAVQCLGFARKISADAYGKSYRDGGWSTGSISNAKPGDVIHYKGAYGADSYWGH